jgi:hypothetical protein
MTVLPQVVDAWVALVKAELPRVQVAAEPPAEDARPATVYLERYESTFRFQCLGVPADQEERIRLLIVARAYVEGVRQRASARDARVRVFELLEAVQRAVMDVDGRRPHQLNGVVSWGRVARWQVQLDPSGDKGWVATGLAVLEATYWP